MDICRLCLQSESQNIPNPGDVLDILTKFLPSVNPFLKQNCSVFQLCEACQCNINTIKNFKNTLSKTDEKIERLIRNSNVKRVDLIYLLETKHRIGTKNMYLCRICLQIIHVPKIFLYENGTNILRYDLIYSMFLFCNITLKYDISQPVMCLQCWDNIQVCYSFKKTYIETNKNIKTYLTRLNISKNDVNEEVLKKMSQYSSTEIKDIIMDKGYSLRKNVKKEYFNGISHIKKIKESNSEAKCNVLPKYTKYNFTTGDDEYLLEFYSEATSKDSNVGTRPWKCVQEKWLNKFPDKPLKVTSIYHRLTTLLKRKPKINIKKVAQEEKALPKKIELMNSFVGDTSIDSDKESDDSFVDEIAPASFMPNINSEPLIDEEVYIIEPKMEHFMDIPPSGTDSDSESLPLPLLERMDLLKVWKVDHHSVDSKRETFNQISQNETINVMEEKKSYMINTKLEGDPETLYKCTSCNFETKYKYSANRHSNWHSNPHKKAFHCNKCNFLTSKQYLLKQHVTDNHQDEEDYAELPVLIPFTITY